MLGREAHSYTAYISCILDCGVITNWATLIGLRFWNHWFATKTVSSYRHELFRNRVPFISKSQFGIFIVQECRLCHKIPLTVFINTAVRLRRPSFRSISDCWTSTSSRIQFSSLFEVICDISKFFPPDKDLLYHKTSTCAHWLHFFHIEIWNTNYLLYWVVFYRSK